MVDENIWQEVKTIPFEEVIRAIRIMGYGSTESVMFQMLARTGCRVTELDKMRMTNLNGSIVRWKKGKNQTGYRREDLGSAYVAELMRYRMTHRVFGDKMFGINHHTFRRYFNRDIRPRLGGLWLEKQLTPYKGDFKKEHVFALKSFRKNFGTHDFFRNWKRYDDASVAMMMTSKRFAHSSDRLTARHYVQEFNNLKLENWHKMSMTQIIDIARAHNGAQMCVTDYY